MNIFENLTQYFQKLLFVSFDFFLIVYCLCFSGIINIFQLVNVVDYWQAMVMIKILTACRQ